MPSPGKLVEYSEPPSSAPRTRRRRRPPLNKSKGLTVAVPVISTRPPPGHVIDISSDLSDSDLTPLTSPLEVRFNTKTDEQQHQRRRSGVGSTLAIPTTPCRKAPHLVDPEPWSVENLGSYVWVLLDRRARVLEPDDNPQQCSEERLWWPGKITSKSLTSVPLRIHLFGTAAPGVKAIEIRVPSQLNVLSLKDSLQRDRFTIPTFINPIAPDLDLAESSKKKSKYNKGDVEERWRVAVTELLQEREYMEESDAMPEVGTLEFAFTSTPSPTKSTKGKGQNRGKRKRKRSDSDDTGDEMEVGSSIDLVPMPARWSPAPADETLQIPGELILATGKKGDTDFWPARILAYIPATKPRKEGKYRVEFLDTRKKDIPRKRFYTFQEEEFGTCKLGRWESEYDEVVNDEDNDNIVSLNHSPSPIPSVLSPQPKEFYKLSVREQLAYTKPVLTAILNEEYPPGKRRHDLFLGGGEGRNLVKNDAGLRGRMNPKDVTKLGEYLCEWCLRDDGRTKILVDGAEVENAGEKTSFGLVGEKVEGTGNNTEIVGDELAEGLLCNSRSRSRSPAETELTSLSQGEVPPESSLYTSENTSPRLTNIPRMTSPVNSPWLMVGDESEVVTSGSEDHIAPPGQRGCKAYEALSGEEKVSYCANVLLPEAILQILLWYNGVRTSVNLLSEAEEATLHDKGEELLRERDWVNDVKRLREMMRASLKLGKEVREDGAGITGSSGEWTYSGRPRRSAVKPISYRE